MHTSLARSSRAPTRQADGKLGEFARRAVDRDRGALLLGDDVVAIERPRPVPSRRFRRKERLKNTVAVFGNISSVAGC